ncbi:MAG: M1 family metallopeptidase [Nitrospirales bacterium]
MDPYRLPVHVVPSRYDLRLEPDLLARTFSGQETVTLTVKEPTQDIVLNAAELDITSAKIREGRGGFLEGTVATDDALERCRLTFPKPLHPGTWLLDFTFQGTLNDKLRGFYRSTYIDENGSTKFIAATQFEATDARRAFPCWDEPAFKAVFSTTLVIPPELTAVSNTAVKAQRLEGGKTVLEFADTIRMSTYLVAFVVGDLQASEPAYVGRTAVRIWAVPGKQPLTKFGREIAAFSLGFFEEYYGQPYPGDKLDLLAIPDFASGAMENLGAITFRETALLVDQRGAAHAELERVADVVAHENAHMWFGDLVTMSWWNGLWLNEAFATFMEMLAVEAWKPEWDRWTTFGVSRAAALSVDGLHSTRPIEFQVRAPKDAEAMFDVLTYEKGASVLRMLEQYLGPHIFREGVRDYLRTHAYGNADTGDLWAAIGRAAGQPVPALLDRWIFGEGYPLITVRLVNGALTLRQQRFTYLPSPTSPADAQKSIWQVPLLVRLIARGQGESRRLLLTTQDATVPIPDGFQCSLVNEGGHGFYRVHYAPELLQTLLALLPDGLTPIERFNLVNDAWATTIAGLMPLSDYLDLTAQFQREHDKNVWAILIDSFHLLNRIIAPSERPGLEALVRDRIRPLVESLGWIAQPNEGDVARQLRGDLLRALGTIGNDPEVQTEAMALYEAHARDPLAVDPNVLPALVAILARTGDAARYEEFVTRYRSARTPQEERRYLYALALFQQRELLDQTLARTINGEIRTQDAPFVVGAVLMSVYGRELAWNFVTANWDTMDRQFPKQGLRRMCGGIVGLATPEWEQGVREFFDSRKIDLGGRTLAQYLEQLHIAVSLREREGAELRGYLSRFSPNRGSVTPAPRANV